MIRRETISLLWQAYQSVEDKLSLYEALDKYRVNIDTVEGLLFEQYRQLVLGVNRMFLVECLQGYASTDLEESCENATRLQILWDSCVKANYICNKQGYWNLRNFYA